MTFFTFLYPNIQRIFDSTMWIIEFIILIIIWNKIPIFNDIFGIKKEIQLILRMGAITLLIYIGWTVKIIILGYDLWIFMIVQFIFGVMVGIMALILNKYVFYKYEELLMIRTREERAGTESEMRSTPITEESGASFPNTGLPNISSNDSNKKQRLTLQQVLGNDDLIQCLFNQLTEEFSIELLLAFIEFKQFHDLMNNDDELIRNIESIIIAKSDDNNIPILSIISLSDKLPKSRIVHINHKDVSDNLERYLFIAQELVYKYISRSAEFEINISYGCKQEIEWFINEHHDLSAVALLSNNEQYQLFKLFDKASESIYRLMQSSHERCVKTNKYSPSAIQQI